MGNRGRISSAALVIKPVSPVDVVARLAPPHDFTDEQAEIWVQIVNTEPADKFALSHWPLLADYCRHTVKARRCAEIERALDADKSTSLDEYEKVWRMARGESASLAMLATKLNLTPKSTVNHRGNKKPVPQGPKLNDY